MNSASDFHVIYLTGAPATGKSSLASRLERTLRPIETFVYSKVLSQYMSARHSHDLSQDQLRQRSSQIVAPEDVKAVDNMLLKLVREKRGESHIVIDSHAVTKESYGFRVTPFTLTQLLELRPTKIFCLYAEAPTVIERMKANSQGRPLVSHFEADFHCKLQASVALMYGIHLGIPVYFLDSSRPQDELADAIIKRLK